MRETDCDFEISGTLRSLRRIFKATQDYSREVPGSFGIAGPRLRALRTISEDRSRSIRRMSALPVFAVVSGA